MKCFNKLKADYAVLLSFISCMFFMGSCNIAYQYDIESGTEDDTADSTNVTIVTYPSHLPHSFISKRL